MSSTRRAAEDSPLSQERYMSSPEFFDLQGISGTAVAARASLVPDPKMRALLWWIQGLSLSPGGLKSLARRIEETFPERMRKRSRPLLGSQPMALDQYLIDLCINPRIRLVEDENEAPIDVVNAMDQYASLERHEFAPAKAPGFDGILSALLELKRRESEKITSDFVLTENGRQIWASLEYAIRGRRMVLVAGREGFGKSEATATFCEAHLGEARLVSLRGITSKTTAFRQIARALGIASGYGRKSTEMQSRVEDVLQRSRLMLVLDEAHWLFNQSQRIYSRPELVDWVGTLCNDRVPVGLICTPQFLKQATKTMEQVDWNFAQFQRRITRTVELKPTSEADLERVAERLLADAGPKAVKLAVGYALQCHRDISGLGDIFAEARLVAGEAGREKIQFSDVRQAYERRIASDAVFGNMTRLTQARASRPERGPQLLADQEEQRPISMRGTDVAPQLPQPCRGTGATDASSLSRDSGAVLLKSTEGI